MKFFILLIFFLQCALSMFAKEFLMHSANYLKKIHHRLSSSPKLAACSNVSMIIDALKLRIDRIEHLNNFFGAYWEQAEEKINADSISSTNGFIKIPNYFSFSHESTSYDPYLLLREMKILIKKQIKVPFRYEGHHYRGFIDRALENLKRIKDYQRNLKRFHQGYDMEVYNVQSFPHGVGSYLYGLLSAITSKHGEKIREYSVAVKHSAISRTCATAMFLSLLDPKIYLWEKGTTLLAADPEKEPVKRIQDASKRKLYTYHRKMEALMDKLSKIKIHKIQFINIMLIQKANYSKLLARSSLSNEIKKERTKVFMENIKIRIRRAVLILELIKAFEEKFKFPMDYNLIKYDQ